MKRLGEDIEVGVVVPAYNEEANIAPLVEQIERSLAGHSYEILFVDDGSTDNTLEAIRTVMKHCTPVQYISLSRNFGHQNALKAGLDAAAGQCVVTMDADLQHPPTLLPDLLQRWRQGYEIVHTIRDNDQSLSRFKRATSSIFYRLINCIAEVEIAEGSADFRLLDRSVVEVLKQINESTPFLRGLIPWTGFRQTSIHYRPAPRYSGQSKYTFFKMVGFALSGLVSFSMLPLRFATFLGFIMATTGFVIGLKAALEHMFTRNTVPGWTSTIVTVVLVGGVQLVILGIMGEYLGRLFIESKKRPNYIIRSASLSHACQHGANGHEDHRPRRRLRR